MSDVIREERSRGRKSGGLGWQGLIGKTYHPRSPKLSPAAEKAARKKARKEVHAGPICIDCRSVSVTSRGERCQFCREDNRTRKYREQDVVDWLQHNPTDRVRDRPSADDYSEESYP